MLERAHTASNRPSRPEVSVVLPVYNGARWLAGAVEALQSQTFTDFEILIVNDGSTDDTRAEVSRLARTDERIVLLDLPVNGGLTNALRKGVEVARGKFIARQDADDLSAPARLELSRRAVGADSLVISRWLTQSPGGKTSEPRVSKLLHYAPAPIRLKAFHYLNLAAHGSFFFPKAFYEQLGGYRTEFPLAQDYDLLLRWSEQGRLVVIDVPLYTVRLHKESIGYKNRKRQYDLAAKASAAAWRRRHGQGEEGSSEPGGVPAIHRWLFKLANDRRYGL